MDSVQAEVTRNASEIIHAWNSRDILLVAPLYATEYEGTDIAQPKPYYGAKGACERLRKYWQGFPDLHFEEEGRIAEGNDVVLLWSAQGTHLGTFMNIPPTGRTIHVKGVSVLKMMKGKIRRGTHVWDVAGLLRSLGLLPDL